MELSGGSTTHIMYRYYKYVFLCFVLLFSSQACVSQEHSPSQLQQNIINGQGDLSHPAIGALVVRKGSSFCTGTLIRRQLVVTAAHCVDAINRYGIQNIQFRVDFTDPNQTFRSEYHSLQQTVNHPQYKAGSGANYDIAVLILRNKVTNVTPIIPNTTAMDTKWIGTTVRVVGYGLIQTRPKQRADQKYAANIPLFQINPRSFIHYDEKTAVAQRKSACHGDSGGPALYTVNGRIAVMGVTSIAYKATATGQGDTYCDGGAVSTRLDANLSFLQPYLLKYADGPAACKVDTDCGICAQCGTKSICEPKPITQETTHCQPCAKDADCGNGICYKFTNGYRCLQTCTSANCCPTGSQCTTLQGQSQSRTVCKPEQTTCPDVSCKADAECGLGEHCDPTTNICMPKLPPRSPKLCHPCTNKDDCGGGDNLCNGPRGQGTCSQPCAVGDFCPEGFLCRSLFVGFPKQCVPSSGTCRVPCLLDQHCATGFTCKDKFCVRKDGGVVGDTCDTGTCKSDLQCANLSSGKVCLQPCGVQQGNAGTDCLADNTCKGSTRCFRNSSYRVCLAACTNANECKGKGGGFCSSVGNCLCRDDSECEADHFCNLFTYQSNQAIGSCAPNTSNRSCPSGQVCAGLDDGQYCIASAQGYRSIGQSCDNLRRCKDGLICLYTQSGARCFEDCTQTKKCSIGGQCVRYGNAANVCLCTEKDCPTGRTCNRILQTQQGTYGYCEADATTTTCIDSRECPIDYDCISGTCTHNPRQPEPQPEPQSEPTPEPQSDASVQPEPQPEPDPTEIKKTVETTPEAPKETLPELPAKGCGCHTQPQRSPSAPIWLFTLVIFFMGTHKTRRR
ncbi:MAG: hypothetical protein CL920_35860 [Deltaproteobacteria bacterium]|nr:hypothetical protein [Deltaproteobacteria bacterium]MBU54103.1 hypothetical protein [Deltaproteobacteria bacterium]